MPIVAQARQKAPDRLQGLRSCINIGLTEDHDRRRESFGPDAAFVYNHAQPTPDSEAVLSKERFVER